MVAKNASKKAPLPKSAAQKKGAKKVQKTIKKESSDKKDKATVDKDFEVNETERYAGTVVFYDKKRGFGFIKLDQTGVIPEDKVMVHWREIQSEDRWPFLYKTLEVECSLKKKAAGRGQYTVCGQGVSLPGGGKLSLQEEQDAKKEFVGDKNMRFLGNVKFYDFKKGFGFVKLQEGYAIDEDVPTEFLVSRVEVSSGDDAPRLANDMEVEFGIQKNAKGQYSCYNVTLPGGDEITRHIAEGRKDTTKATFKGKVSFFDFKTGMGFIIPEDAKKFPKQYQEALKADKEKRDAKANKKDKKTSEEAAVFFASSDKADRTDRLVRNDACSFKLYLDNKGIGACEVKKA